MPDQETGRRLNTYDQTKKEKEKESGTESIGNIRTLYTMKWRKDRSLPRGSNHSAKAADHAGGNGAHEDRSTVGAHGPGEAIRGAEDLTGSAGPATNVVGEVVVGGGLSGENTGLRDGGGTEGLGDLGHGLRSAAGGVLVGLLLVVLLVGFLGLVVLVLLLNLLVGLVGLLVVGGVLLVLLHVILVVLGLFLGGGLVVGLVRLAVRLIRLVRGGRRVGAQEWRIAAALVTLAIGLANDVVTRLREINTLALDGHTVTLLLNVGNKELREAVEASLSVLSVAGGLLHRGMSGLLVLSLGVFSRLVVGVVGIGLIAVGAATNGNHGAVHVHLTVSNLVEPGPSKQSLTIRRIGGNLEVVLLGGRACSQHGLNDLEGLSLIVGQSELARTSVVGCATVQLHLVGLARLVGSLGVELVISVTLAGVVGTRCLQWVGV